MIRTPILFACLMAITPLSAQFYDDFDELNDLSQGAWTGDVDKFTINEAQQLQLNASGAGSASLYRLTNIPDSLEIGLYLKLDFSPSASNKIKIFLQLDTFDLSMASGYYLEIGENGSEDKIRFVRLIHGQGLTLGEGSPGHFSEEPVECHIHVTRDPNGWWQISSRRPGENLFEAELELFDSTIKRHFDQYFGFECTFTSTRKDKFFFDDVYLAKIVPDTLPPALLSCMVSGPKSLVLSFDELLDNLSAMNVQHYFLQNTQSFPQTAFFNEFKPNIVRLEFAEEFKSNTIYQLAVGGIKDLEGNRLKDTIRKEFYLREIPEPQDLVVNEILFNPVDDGPDFVEILNRSPKILDLRQLIIRNDHKEEESAFPFPLTLFPGEMVAISQDTAWLRNYYSIPDSARLFQMDLPGFNNDSGNASICQTLENGTLLIDSFDYDEEMHFDLIRDPEGISLERLSPEHDSNDPFNWQSASTLSGGATPGYRNSHVLSMNVNSTTSDFFLEDPVFSPDNDGYQDFLMLHYRLPGDGFVLTVKVFDSSGEYAGQLVHNQLSGREGIIRWDGMDAAGKCLPVGPYILYCSGFNEEGKTFHKKLVAYLVCPL